MSENQGSVRLTWRDIAIWSLILSVALVAVTSIVATVKDADTLSVVALALAVIAFVAQIIVFIVQAAAANDQQMKSQEVYAQTMKALTLIEEKMEGTRQTVNTMSEHLLVRVLNGTLPESVAKEAVAADIGISSPNDASLPDARPGVRGTAERRRRLEPEASRRLAYPPPDEDRGRNKKILDLMTQFPAGDILQETKAIVEASSTREGYYLSLMASDEVRNRRPGSTVGPGLGMLDSELAKRLYEKGLVRQVRVPQEPAKAVYVLTDKGRNVARIFTAVGDPPAGFPAEILDFVDRTREYQNELKRVNRAINPDIPVEDA